MHNKFFSDTKYAISVGILAFVVVSLFASVFLIVKTVSLGDNEFPYENSITLVGEGEIVVIPDVATFTYTVSEVSETAASAQVMANEKSNAILSLLKDSGVDDNDIKTLNYNIFPKYEWRSEVCISGPCNGGKNVVIGQEVSQTFQVKIKDTEKSGELLSLVGSQEVKNISGLSFSIDDEESLKKQAREKAIENAKSKANNLAKQLGVQLVKIVGFSEDSDDRSYYGGEFRESAMMSMDAKSSPEIPTGENTVSSKVYITFEIED